MSRKRPHKGRTRRPSNRSGRPPRTETVEGVVRVHGSSRATVETQAGSFDVARRGLREAMNGDTVTVSVVRTGPGTPVAYVQGVLHRAVETFLGTYESVPPLGVVRPLDARLGHDFFVPPQDESAGRLGVGEGDIVVARIVGYPSRGEAGVVTLVRRLGATEGLDMAMESLVASYDLPTSFPGRALGQAEGMSADVEEALRGQPGRRDLRDGICVTVDPIDARDFDDAVHAERLPEGGFRLHVHIADVTHYVGWDTPIDNEAKQRTCSVYLADRVVPMLPERLCNDVCSLRPGEDRLAMSVTVELDERGEVRDFEAFPSVIRSSARLDYDLVDRLLDGACASDELPSEEVARSLQTLDEVARLRLAVRAARGSVDFESAETKVELDSAGHPTGVHIRQRTRATSLVEEAMLVANECVADMLSQAGLESAYRVHDRPPAEGLLRALPVLVEAGLTGGGLAERIGSGDPFALQEALARAHGTPVEAAANALLLRAQARAEYAPHNQGHYALGARAYCHFTSPIRRYPDMLVHRTLKALLARSLDLGDEGRSCVEAQRRVVPQLPQLCMTCSERERTADAASRDSQRIKLAELLSTHVGEVHAGVVSGCERYGMFVLLEEFGAEGLVRMRSMGDEWVSFDDERLVLVGQSTGRTWRLGQRVACRIVATNSARGQIDLELVGGQTGTVRSGVH
ncbi:MAG: VacB/RNase II family 3'-5' exoribonuclease [Atopobiaceae bacterium]|nr:VacB/RNase II family 3'-5' exoribonuclease [Atopobiaceae bacterium]MBQ6650788.1 VacB/RNase II family 3'-5' exoribonuclease [Atopobiaceae bacterium]